MNIRQTVTVMTSREFNQDTARAKRAARNGPVSITERGRPAYVLLTEEEYERLKAAEEARGRKPQYANAAEALAHPESAHLDFDIPEFKGSWGLKIPDFDD